MKNIKHFTKVIFIVFIFNHLVAAQTDDKKILINKLNHWIESFNKKVLQKSLEIFSEEYVALYPGQPDQKFTDVKKQYEQIFTNKNLNVSLKFGIVESEVGGEFAFIHFVLITTVKPTFVDKAQSATDRGFQIWKKQTTGDWKLIRSISFPKQ